MKSGPGKKEVSSDSSSYMSLFKLYRRALDSQGQIVLTSESKKGIEKILHDHAFILKFDESTDTVRFSKRLKKYLCFINSDFSLDPQTSQETYCGFKPGFLNGKRF